MTPTDRHQRELDRIFELGRQVGRAMPPLTDEQIAQVAFIIKPRLAAPRDHASTALPQAA